MSSTLVEQQRVCDTTWKAEIQAKYWLLNVCLYWPLYLPQRVKMGLTFTKLFARLFSKKEMRILMVSDPVHGCFCECLTVLLISLKYAWTKRRKAVEPVDHSKLRVV